MRHNLAADLYKVDSLVAGKRQNWVDSAALVRQLNSDEMPRQQRQRLRVSAQRMQVGHSEVRSQGYYQQLGE